MVLTDSPPFRPFVLERVSLRQLLSIAGIPTVYTLVAVARVACRGCIHPCFS